MSYTVTGARAHGFHRAAGRVRQAASGALRAVKIGMRAARVLATSKALPLPLRILLVIGMIQVPVLPFDEVALAVALGWLALRHRSTLRGALVTAAAHVDAR